MVNRKLNSLVVIGLSVVLVPVVTVATDWDWIPENLIEWQIETPAAKLYASPDTRVVGIGTGSDAHAQLHVDSPSGSLPDEFVRIAPR